MVRCCQTAVEAPPQSLIRLTLRKRRARASGGKHDAQASAVSATLFPTKELTFLEVDHYSLTWQHSFSKEVPSFSNIDMSAVFEFIYSENYTSIMSPSMGLSSRLDLSRALKWMFASPQWITNVFWVLICTLLGTVVIGNIVLLGYQVDIVDRRSKGRQDQLPDFDANRFMDYLLRGLWPFLINLIGSAVFGMIIGALILVCVIALGVISGGQEPNPGVAFVVFFPLALASLLFGFFAFSFLAPLCLRAGLANDISEGMKFQWALGVAKMMWPTMLLMILYMIIVGILAYIVGLVMCIIGVFFTMSWAQLVTADLAAQAYDIYLTKGGEEIPTPMQAMQAEIL